MKKILMILTILFALPFTVFASDVKITKIEVLDKTGSTETRKSTYEGMVANLNFDVTEPGDSVKYKITIQNDGNKVFNVDLKENGETAKYFDYVYTGDTKIEPGKTGTITVEATYVKYLDKEDLDIDSYQAKATLNITSDEVTDTPAKKPEKKNPETGLASKVIIICSAGVVLMGISLYLNTKHKSKFKAYLFLPLLVIPVIMDANAAEKLTININSNITVKPFILRLIPYIHGEGEWDDEDNFYKYVDKSEIYSYEIPMKYNSIYDSDPDTLSSGDVSKEEIINTLKTIAIEETDTKAIEDFKKSTSEVYITYKETKRTIIYKAYAFSGEIEFLEMIVEYDKATEDLRIISGECMPLEDIINYMLSTTNKTINCEDIICEDMTEQDMLNQLNSITDDYIVFKRGNVTAIYLKDIISDRFPNYHEGQLADRFEDEEYFSSYMKLSYNVGNNKYLIYRSTRINSSSPVCSNDKIAYYLENYN